MKLIVGLGNPGKEYENTYHNIGFMVLDKLAEILNIKINKGKFNSLYGKGFCKSEEIVLVKPLTYMNLSGEAVRDFVNFYKLYPQDVIVICDDIDLERGNVRYREKGSGGTHNGLKNIVYNLQSENFKRVKIGIGRDENMDLKDYVLSRIQKEAMAEILPSFDKAVDKILGLFR